MRTNQKYLRFFCLAGLALALDGCTTLNNILTPPPPPPAPRALWQSSPGFSAAAIEKIAIVSENTSQNASWNSRDSFMTAVEDQFIKAALQKGYRVSDRSDVDRVMQEIRFQQSGLTEGDAARLGRMLNVPAVLIVKITGYGVVSKPNGLILNGVTQYDRTAWCEMSARLVSVEGAEILGLASYSAKRPTEDENDKGPAMYLAATRLASVLPGRDSQ